jgi:hypothetical protein
MSCRESKASRRSPAITIIDKLTFLVILVAAMHTDNERGKSLLLFDPADFNAPYLLARRQQ